MSQPGGQAEPLGPTTVHPRPPPCSALGAGPDPDQRIPQRHGNMAAPRGAKGAKGALRIPPPTFQRTEPRDGTVSPGNRGAEEQPEMGEALTPATPTAQMGADWGPRDQAA